MKEGSVYNLIDKLDPKDLKYLSSDNIQVDVLTKLKKFQIMQLTWHLTGRKKGKGLEYMRFYVLE